MEKKETCTTCKQKGGYTKQNKIFLWLGFFMLLILGYGLYSLVTDIISLF